MLSFGALNGERANELYELIESVNREEQLIDAIGEQAHFAETLVGPARMVQTLDRFARLGLPIRITELDIVTEDEQLQADYLRDFLTAAFSHPAVDGIVLWGFWEGQINKPQAALWRKDWSLKPAGRVFVDLLTDKWSTDVSLVSDDRGRVDFRGFRGEYELTVNASGATRTVRAHLTGGESVVTLP
jgi:endo-1,4-beta-xylanase